MFPKVIPYGLLSLDGRRIEDEGEVVAGYDFTLILNPPPVQGEEAIGNHLRKHPLRKTRITMNEAAARLKHGSPNHPNPSITRITVQTLR